MVSTSSKVLALAIALLASHAAGQTLLKRTDYSQIEVFSDADCDQSAHRTSNWGGDCYEFFGDEGSFKLPDEPTSVNACLVCE